MGSPRGAEGPSGLPFVSSHFRVSLKECAQIFSIANLRNRIKYLFMVDLESMPEISRFLGIVIKMFYGDHSPPHFHAVYGDYDASFSIETLEVMEGKLPPRVKGLVIEWATQHQDELMENWRLITKKDKQSFKPIKPLVE